MYRTADSIWVVRYRFTPCCYRQELQQCRDLNTRMLSLPNPIDAFPLACMYADTADWATSTAESFIRETELIQARLLEWPNGELVPACAEALLKSVYMQPSSASMSSRLVGATGAPPG
jgi:hypothetical protein